MRSSTSIPIVAAEAGTAMDDAAIATPDISRTEALILWLQTLGIAVSVMDPNAEVNSKLGEIPPG